MKLYQDLCDILILEGGVMLDSRLFKMLYYLLDRERATAPELAAEFEVSTRTIYRDVEALSSAGIPIVFESFLHREAGFSHV